MVNRILFFVVALLCSNFLAAQPKLTLPNYKHYTLRDGLSQMQVVCMMQDSRGYIWVGTKAGLNCFNGEKFVSYTNSKYPEISNDYIDQICEDSNGRIWASTHEGILRVDGKNLKFFKAKSLYRLPITTDNKGRLWFTQNQFPDTKLEIKYIENDSIYSGNVFNIRALKLPTIELQFIEEENKLLLACDSVLYRIDNSNLVEIDNNFTNIYFLPNLKSIYYIDWYHPKENSVLNSYNFDLKEYRDRKVNTVAKIRNGRYIEKPGIKSSIQFTTTNTIQIQALLLTTDSIIYDISKGIQSNTILKDREENIWIGSEEGVFQLFGDAFTAYNREILPQIWAVTEDLKGNIWFSSFLFGITKQEGNKLTKYPNYFIKEGAFHYFHPVTDKKGRLFFPNGYGILKVDGNRFEQKSDRMYLTAFCDEKSDLLWAGGSKRAVAYNAGFQKERTVDETDGLNVGKNVLTIGRDSAGFYWFGGGEGVARYNMETKTLKNYNPGNRNYGVVSQCNDYRGRTWFGTEGGLFWVDTAKDSLIQLAPRILDEQVNLVATIDSNWLIVSQPYGIYLMDLEKYYQNNEVILHLFNEKNGFTGIEPGQDGAFTDSKGNIWITTGTELMKLDPRKLKIGNHSLSVRINKCNGQALPFVLKTLELPHNQNSAVITFDAICFSRPNPVEFSWKLENDTAWSAWQEENYAVLSGLGDGNTKMLVRAQVKGLPLETPALAEITVGVRIAYYRQTWFLPALFAFISFVGISILMFALLQTKRAGKEARVYQVQAIQSQMNPHFIFNVLASLQSVILKNNISKANDYLVKLADLIRGFLEASAGTGALKSPNSDQGQVTLANELKLLYDFVEFQQLINPGKFEFEVKTESNIDIEKELIPPLLIQPFVENAIRHGILPLNKKGILQLLIGKTDDALTIEIIDNGIGVKKSRQMFEKSPMRYTSRGKELTLNRVYLLNQLGFKIGIETKSNDCGTHIKIKLNK